MTYDELLLKADNLFGVFIASELLRPLTDKCFSNDIKQDDIEDVYRAIEKHLKDMQLNLDEHKRKSRAWFEKLKEAYINGKLK